ncbi:hypothetical protein Gotur_030194 [Gossypium turneri]
MSQHKEQNRDSKKLPSMSRHKLRVSRHTAEDAVEEHTGCYVVTQVLVFHDIDSVMRIKHEAVAFWARVLSRLSIKHRLLTNVERLRRGLGIDTACGICGHNYENVLHVLRDCTTAREIWMQLISSESASHKPSGRSQLDLSVRDYHLAHLEESKPMHISRYLGNCEVIDSELWGILDGLKIAHDCDFQKVIIWTDNLEVVNLIHEGVRKGSNSTLVRRIVLFLKLFSHWNLQDIPREENKIADKIVKLR